MLTRSEVLVSLIRCIDLFKGTRSRRSNSEEPTQMKSSAARFVLESRVGDVLISISLHRYECVGIEVGDMDLLFEEHG